MYTHFFVNWQLWFWCPLSQDVGWVGAIRRLHRPLGGCALVDGDKNFATRINKTLTKLNMVMSSCHVMRHDLIWRTGCIQWHVWHMVKMAMIWLCIIAICRNMCNNDSDWWILMVLLKLSYWCQIVVIFSCMLFRTCPVLVILCL